MKTPPSTWSSVAVRAANGVVRETIIRQRISLLDKLEMSIPDFKKYRVKCLTRAVASIKAAGAVDSEEDREALAPASRPALRCRVGGRPAV
jgi:hypothetical protein